jgi:hypothetical protein
LTKELSQSEVDKKSFGDQLRDLQFQLQRMREDDKEVQGWYKEREREKTFQYLFSFFVFVVKVGGGFMPLREFIARQSRQEHKTQKLLESLNGNEHHQQLSATSASHATPRKDTTSEVHTVFVGPKLDVKQLV